MQAVSPRSKQTLRQRFVGEYWKLLPGDTSQGWEGGQSDVILAQVLQKGSLAPSYALVVVLTPGFLHQSCWRYLLGLTVSRAAAGTPSWRQRETWVRTVEGKGQEMLYF